MTDHDQDAAIGGLAKRCSTAKRTRAALSVDVIKATALLEEFVQRLRIVNGNHSLEAQSVPKVPVGYLDAATWAAMLDELRTACHEIALTQRHLKDAGVDVS